MRGARLALALVLALGLGAAACTSPGDDPGLPVAVDPAVIYAQMCARCHGADGRGDPQIRQQRSTTPVKLAPRPSADRATTASLQARLASAHEETARLKAENHRPAPSAAVNASATYSGTPTSRNENPTP